MNIFMRFIGMCLALLAIQPTDILSRAKSHKPAYSQINPISIPQNLPSMQEIAQTIIEPIGAQQFLCGASTSEHQCSTQCTPKICSASKWALENNFSLPTDAQYQMDWWNNYKTYIDDAVNQLGVKAIRLSVEMALIQPDGPDSWDRLALKHYGDLFTYCLRKGVTPLVCFHHYTDPNWFVDRGGFEKIKNVDYFVQQCVKVYETIMDAVSKDTYALIGLKQMYPREPLWITFNAAEGYAFRGYYAESGPPSIPDRSGLLSVAKVVKNCCEATVRVSAAIKDSFQKMTIPCVVHEPKIGFLKNIHQVDVARETISQKIVSGVTRFMIGFADQIRNDAIYNFFTKGIFEVKLPMGSIKHKNRDAVGCLDFIGLNYYSNRYMSLTSAVRITDSELTTDSDYYHYPQGVYRAIVELYEKCIWLYEKATEKKLPMYVSENGIATDDDQKRSRFYSEYLYAIARAVEDGYSVYGYLPWALFDNYEWPAKHIIKKRNYGIFAVNEDGTHLTLKQGSRSLKEFSQAVS